MPAEATFFVTAVVVMYVIFMGAMFYGQMVAGSGPEK